VNATSGQLSEHHIESQHLLIGGSRRVRLYQPATTEASPLLVVFDGQDYTDQGDIIGLIEGMVAEKEIRPLALALLDHAGQGRVVEYLSDSTYAVVCQQVLPLAQQNLQLLPEQANGIGQYGLLGASMGGLIALNVGARAPHIFGKVIRQSGAFGMRGGLEPLLLSYIRHAPPPPLQVWLDVGLHEFLLEPNRRMRNLLAERGYAVEYREFEGGHNYPDWRNALRQGLRHLFPPVR
jgi:enterochelin esterase-like enzyme